MSALYDDSAFFSAYAAMPRSRLGLAGAPEWHALHALLPEARGLDVLDLGCGYGWHAAHFAREGARRVLALDASKRMLERARTENADPRIEYEPCDLNDPEAVKALPGRGPFDLVLASLVIHYLDDYPGLVRVVHNTLRPGGTFAFNVEHPVFTAQGSQDWIYGPGGEIEYFPVDRYAFEGPRETNFLGSRVRKVHRTLGTYLQTLLDAGFVLRNVVEPKPLPEAVAADPRLADELRRPMMLLVRADKPA